MPRPCAAETASGSPSPRPWKSCDERRRRCGVSILLAASTTGSAAAAQHVGDLLVAGAQPGARVDDEQRDVGVGERLARLVLDRDGERVGVLEVDAAGVDQREAGGRSSRSRAPCGRA